MDHSQTARSADTARIGTVLAGALIVIGLGVSSWAAPTADRIVAGSDRDPDCTESPFSDAGANHAATAARFDGGKPWLTVTLDAAGIPYVGDTDWVRRVDVAADQIRTVAGVAGSAGSPSVARPIDQQSRGGPPAANGAVATTVDVHVLGLTSSGRSLFFVSDADNAGPGWTMQVFRLDDVPNATLQLLTEYSSDHLDPRGMAVAGNNLYIVEAAAQGGGGRVLVVPTGGGTPTPLALDGLNEPESIVVDATGSTAYIAGAERKVQKFNITLNLQTLTKEGELGKEMSTNAGKRLALDSDEALLFVSDPDAAEGTIHQIELATPNAEPKLLAGEGTSAEKIFVGGMAVSPQDHQLYVMDEFQCALWRLPPLAKTSSTTTGGGPTTSPTTAPPGTQPPPAPPSGNPGGNLNEVPVPGDQGNLATQTGGATSPGSPVAQPGGAFVAPGPAAGQPGGGVVPPGPPPPAGGGSPGPGFNNLGVPPGGPPLGGPQVNPHAAFGGASSDPADGAPRYAMVRNQTGSASGDVVGFALLASGTGCLLFALGLARQDDRGRRSTAASRSRPVAAVAGLR
jgi:hypothetical protein